MLRQLVSTTIRRSTGNICLRIAFIRPIPSILRAPSVYSTDARHVSTSLPVYTQKNFTAAQLSTENYHYISNETLEHMVSQLEELLDNTDEPGYDVEYTQGVLTLSLGEHGTYVINKQPPNHQIWLSSPISGPQRYDYDIASNKWFYHRDNHTLDEVLNTELSKVFKQELRLLKDFQLDKRE
ncbi:hypothetical protein BDB01DRAFT_855589 [Pilobolus umbonatus]|nr:hypothetical protein BDB01DRAFT_855589 [Pilobolus umbonatus]